MRYYLGLDNGGTSTKAAVFTCDGKEVGVCATDTKMITPRPGFVERDMEEMWQANCRVIREVLAKTDVLPEEIAGIGVCGHGKGLYLWGKNDAPARPGIISTDNRAYAYPQCWREDDTEAKAKEKNCQSLMACQPAALLSWLRDHESGLLEKVRWIFSCKDYIRFRLTGQAGAELTDMSGTGLLNLYTRNYDDELLQLFGLSDIREALPPLCASTEICGQVTKTAAADCGLLEGTPVIGGMFDIDACALAVGITDERNLCMIAGTWSINEYLRREPVLDGTVAMNSLFCLPEYYLIEESSPTSAGNHAWFARQLLPELREQAKSDGKSVYAIMDQWVEQIPPETFVPIFLPFLMASNAHPNAKGTLIGMTAAHTRQHLCRSIYEGIAFSHRWHLDKLLRSRPTGDTPCIRLAGGAARVRVWAQMFADVMGLPVETVAANETGALGCAIAIAAAVGDYPSLHQAAGTMCSVTARLEPDGAAHRIYEEKYRLYCKTIHCLEKLWPEMQIAVEKSCCGQR